MTIKTLLEELAGRSRFGQLFPGACHVTVVSAAFLLVLNGCVAPETTRPAAPVTVITPPAAAPSALTAEAEAALLAAEQSVIEARVKRALWTAAVDELGKARSAAKIFDSNATVVHSREVVALCASSLQQLNAEPVKW